MPRARLRGERGGGQRDAGRAAVEQRRDILAARVVEGDRAPHAERLAEREHAVVPGVEDRLRLGAGERLDAERARHAHQHAVDAVAPDLAAAALGIVRGGVERGLGLAGEDERQPVARAPQARRLGTAFEGREERLGPEVLVDVEAREGHGHAIIPIKPTGFVGYAVASSSASDGALVEEIARFHSVDFQRTRRCCPSPRSAPRPGARPRRTTQPAPLLSAAQTRTGVIGSSRMPHAGGGRDRVGDRRRDGARPAARRRPWRRTGRPAPGPRRSASRSAARCSIDGHRVLDERAGAQLAVLVVGELLEQRPADALRGAAVHLALDERGVQRAADVLGDDVAQQRHGAGLAVHADVARDARRRRARGWSARRRRSPRSARTGCRSVRTLAARSAIAIPRLGRADGAHLAVDDLEVLGGDLELGRGDLAAAARAPRRRRAATARPTV